MKKLLHCRFLNAAFVLLLLAFGSITAQTSVQNFGTGTGSHSSTTGSTGFLPSPTSGTTYTRAGAGASINLVTAPNPLGTADAYVRGTASTSASLSKFSPIVTYTGAPEFYTSFKVLFGNSSAGSGNISGSWTFYQGAGGMYTSNADFSGTEVFTGLRFT